MFASFELRPEGLTNATLKPRLVRSDDGCLPCGLCTNGDPELAVANCCFKVVENENAVTRLNLRVCVAETAQIETFAHGLRFEGNDKTLSNQQRRPLCRLGRLSLHIEHVMAAEQCHYHAQC